MAMSLAKQINVIRASTAADRELAVQVLQSTYVNEKHWIQDEEKFFPPSDLEAKDISWFVASNATQPIGVLRVMYNPPLELYKEYGMQALESGLDVEAFVKNNRIAEIGRFAVVPEFRKFIVVAAALMREASRETVANNFTHYVTDIFEGEVHSPYDFHTRVMGFQPVATHDVGELNCPNRRITMVLDLKSAYQRIQTKQKWIYRYLTKDWDESLHEKLRNGSPS
ncbi:MAG: GNAT family N-acetyltransferase [Verrucomicrobia bacterium]|nr:GNAT family N-acetyltransferase [Verrucomicrobiota bacterium]